MTQQLVWLITGTSSGLGRLLALAALQRGDLVVATARSRSIASLEDLKEKGAKVVELDVTDSLDNLAKKAKEVVDLYGRVDVVVNNAGYIQFGTIEESTPQEAQSQFDTNIFGALNVTRAFLPYMRERKTGTVVWIGSIGGYTAGPAFGLYSASKFALRALSMALHQEIKGFGLRSLDFDFGYFRTDFLSSGNRAAYEPRVEAYRPVASAVNDSLEAYNGKQPGDPEKGVRVIVDCVRGEGLAQGGKAFPETGLLLGSDSYAMLKAELEKTLNNLEEWKEVTMSTDF